MNSTNTTSHNSSVTTRGREHHTYYTAMHEETLRFVRATTKPARLALHAAAPGARARITERFAPDELVLADPSADMLDIARAKLGGANVRFIQAETRALEAPDDHFDVVTAIQSHHYYSAPERAGATARCFRLLKKGGLYITLGNRPNSEAAPPSSGNQETFQMDTAKRLEQRPIICQVRHRSSSP